jgi:undecaprenyl-diphosphatase
LQIDSVQAIVLAIVQGLTEFLPISSSGHLILFPAILGWPDQGQGFDVALHVGSLAAVIFYFKTDMLGLLGAVPQILKGQSSKQTRLFLNLLVATLPALLAAYLLKDWIEVSLRGALLIAVSSIGFGILLWHSDRRRINSEGLDEMNSGRALIIGLAQILALLPGTSRSGITITAARYLGYDRKQAARFSFLMSIPIIAAAGLYKTIELAGVYGRLETEVQWDMFALGTIVSAVSAYLCIVLFLQTIQRVGMLPFVIYRVLLGLFLFYVFW